VVDFIIDTCRLKAADGEKSPRRLFGFSGGGALSANRDEVGFSDRTFFATMNLAIVAMVPVTTHSQCENAVGTMTHSSLMIRLVDCRWTEH
jgi:hypothetical protein